ncbi:hypothetical protein [Caballeronia mineralivorans]|jgi:hypothetical protein|uniref:hypothetical protein n=1 Tax=Caballeronia mineralivorans TaxID=2010198 RepID=UPI002AFE808D|nr:hypothetical protein [Caballeronia mineralivorans]MEA3099683.1 hypothetical protein [Caballeronia mineralivorans]
MNPVEAKTTPERLARGIDPEIGEIFAEQSSFNTRRLSERCSSPCRNSKSSLHQRRRRERPENAGRSWSDVEDAKLLKSFDAGVSPKDLARQHGRTKGAIDSRLVKLGRVGMFDRRFHVMADILSALDVLRAEHRFTEGDFTEIASRSPLSTAR